MLTQSADGGVDLFVKKKKRSLFVHFQGHPEYGAQTLTEGIPARHQEIPQRRARDVSLNAKGVF